MELDQAAAFASGYSDQENAFENAITVVIALGGSTNAVLHLIAMAHSANVPLELDDFTRIGKRVPVLADLKPSGRFLMSELVDIGGQTPLMKMLLDEGLLHGNCMTVTGKTLAENLKKVKPYPKGQEIVRGRSPIPSRLTAIWWCSTATSPPKGAVAKYRGKEGLPTPAKRSFSRMSWMPWRRSSMGASKKVT